MEIETLSVDSRGALWITAGNESAATIVDGKFRLVRERNAQPRWHPLQVVAEDSNAVYLASFHPAVFRAPRAGAVNEARQIDLDPPPPPPSPVACVQSADGALWYITENHQVARLEFSAPEGRRFTVYRLPSAARVLAKDSGGNLWVAAEEHFGVITTNGFSERPPKGAAPRGVRQMIASQDGGLWIWDGEKLGKILAGAWIAQAEQFRPSTNSQTLQFFADSKEGLWVIEYGVGLWQVRADVATTLLTTESGLPSKFITCWLEDNEGNVWIGTKEAGLARIRRRQFKEFTTADGIPGDVAQSVCEDAQGTVWVGTATGGLARKEGERFIPVPITPHPNPLQESVTVFPDATNGIWIGTLQGSVYRCASNQVHCVDDEVTWSFPLEHLRDHVANAMMQDSKGRVWFGNGSGAYYFQEGKLTTFAQERGFVENVGVRALAEDARGALWFGTEPGGRVGNRQRYSDAASSAGGMAERAGFGAIAGRERGVGGNAGGRVAALRERGVHADHDATRAAGQQHHAIAGRRERELVGGDVCGDFSGVAGGPEEPGGGGLSTRFHFRCMGALTGCRGRRIRGGSSLRAGVRGTGGCGSRR